jgi:exportin-1
VLVAIVKHEWTSTWQNFIPEVCEASKTHQGLCENILYVLKLLSEEIFDFSKEELTSKRAKELKETMVTQFSSIYELCVFVFDTFEQNQDSVKKALVKSCLKTFASFLSWIPFGYIFETDLIKKLLDGFFVIPTFRNDTLPCLVEIASLDIDENEEKQGMYVETQFRLFLAFIAKLQETTGGVNLVQEFHSLNERQVGFFEVFCIQTTLLLTEFLKNNLA